MENSKRSLSNNVIRHASADNKRHTVVLPAYLRFNFKKMTGINIAETQARMSGTLLLSIYYKGLPATVVEFIQSNIEVAINEQQFHTLSNKQASIHQNTGKMHIHRNQKQFLINVHWRNQFPLELSCEDVFYSPFSLLNLEFLVTLRSLKFLDHASQIHYAIKFNLMKLEPLTGLNMHTLFSVHKDDRGEYSVAQGDFDVSVTTIKEKTKSQTKNHAKVTNSAEHTSLLPETDTISQFAKSTYTKIGVQRSNEQQAHDILERFDMFQNYKVEFGMYKYPFTTVLTIFLPIMMLAVLNLAVFFQENSLSGRISSLATIMVAYTAFLPTVRDRIPPSPTITAMDLILMGLCCNCMLCLLRSFLDFGQDPSYIYDWKSDPLYLLSLTAIATIGIIVVAALVIHKTIWEPRYNKLLSDEKFISEKFNSEIWTNSECDSLISSIRETYGSTILEILEERIEDSGQHNKENIATNVVMPRPYKSSRLSSLTRGGEEPKDSALQSS